MSDNPPVSSTWPMSARIAAILLLLVGLTNAVVGVVAMASGPNEISTSVEIGLLAAGLATTVVGWLVWRKSHHALNLALVVFQVLLVARLVTAGGNVGALGVSLAVLVVLVVVLWWAAIQVRRQRQGVPAAGG